MIAAVEGMFRHVEYGLVILLAFVGLRPVAAQSYEQRLLDTLVLTGGVLPGYLTSNVDHVLRMHYGPDLELHRFAENGTPLWWRRYYLNAITWEKSAVVSDGGEGAYMSADPTLTMDAVGMPLLTQFIAHVDGSGTPLWSVEVTWSIAISELDGLLPTTRLLRAADGGCIMVLSSSEPGYPNLLITRFSAVGEVLWSRVFNDPLWPLSPAWGSPDTHLCADADGGLYIARQDQGLGSVSLARINGGGDVLWIQRFAAPSGYSMETFDVALDHSGDVLVLGRLFGAELPSGGSLLRVSAAGELSHAGRYQWDLGRRLFVRSSGALAAVKIPWIYVFDEEGAVHRTHAFDGWVIEPHYFVFTMTNMEVAGEHLWMQGVLRRVLIQFNTQTSRPAFFTHSVDAIDGCQWTSGDGFGHSQVEPSEFLRESTHGAVTTDLVPRMTLLPRSMTLSIPSRLAPDPFCDQLVGLSAEPTPPSEGFRLEANPPLQSGLIQLLDVQPGTLRLMDLQGRLIWSGESSYFRESWSLPVAGLHGHPLVLHWCASDGSSVTVRKVLLP